MHNIKCSVSKSQVNTILYNLNKILLTYIIADFTGYVCLKHFVVY